MKLTWYSARLRRASSQAAYSRRYVRKFMKNKIIIATLLLLFFLNSISVFSEQIDPERFVIDLIKNAQENNLKGVLDHADLVKIASHPRHAMQPEEFIEFLKGVDLNKIEFQKIVNRETEQGKILVRILRPISYDFKLELQPYPRGEISTRVRVVSIHP